MTTNERQIRLSEALNGMQLARPVGAATGPILMTEGSILDTESIVSLSRRGVQAVWISNSGAVTPSAQDSDANPCQTTESRLDQLFRQSTGNSEGVILLELLKRYKSRNSP